MASKESYRTELRSAARQLGDRCLYSAAKWYLFHKPSLHLSKPSTQTLIFFFTGLQNSLSVWSRTPPPLRPHLLSLRSPRATYPPLLPLPTLSPLLTAAIPTAPPSAAAYEPAAPPRTLQRRLSVASRMSAHQCQLKMAAKVITMFIFSLRLTSIAGSSVGPPMCSASKPGGRPFSLGAMRSIWYCFLL